MKQLLHAGVLPSVETFAGIMELAQPELAASLLEGDNVELVETLADTDRKSDVRGETKAGVVGVTATWTRESGPRYGTLRFSATVVQVIVSRLEGGEGSVEYFQWVSPSRMDRTEVGVFGRLIATYRVPKLATAGGL